MSKKMPRDIELINGELKNVLTREANDVVTVGNLLTEARSQIDHGHWLSWLEANFSLSIRSAENYMLASNFAAKYETVANLKLRPSALYLLGREIDDPDTLINKKALKAIFKEAEVKWVSATRANDIALSLFAPPPKAIVEIDEIMAAEEAEIEDLLDGPPPELPPAPDTTTHDVILPPFEQAIKTLSSLQSKPLGKFSDTACKPDDIRAIGKFLSEVADAIDRKWRAQTAA
jgi:hypothetical protein